MSLFDLKKKEHGSPQCDPKGDPADCSIIVLGACCQKSTDTFSNVQTAVEELGLNIQVLNIGDAVEIAKYGVMQTPALVINNKVVSLGKLIKVSDAKKLIEAAGSLQ